MHTLSEITLNNFRSCDEATFPLSGFTPLVGYNNGGKSNILDSIRWLLKSSALAKKDFYDSEKPVVVSGVISGITEELLNNLIEKHRNRIEPYCTDGILRIRRIQPSPGGSAKNIILEVRNPDIDDQSAENSWDKNPTGIDAAIKAIFPEPIEIRAMEDAAEDVAKSKTGTTIGKLINEIMQPIEQQHGDEISNVLDGIRRRLDAEGVERVPELNAFDEGANEKLRDLFPGVRIRVHVPTPQIRDLFKSGTIKVFEEGLEIGRDITAIGHGAQRSIQMALVRYLAEMKAEAAQNPARTVLLIDEPELYLHPQAIEQVRMALKTLSEQGYQVVFATHSPQMIHANDIANTLIIRKADNRCTYARKRLTDAINEVIEDAPSQTQTLFELSNSSQILFSERVLIAEGRTEERLIPEIYQLEKGKTLGASKIALISPGGSGNIIKCLKILDVMNIPAQALVDLDFAFRDAVRANIVNEDDEDLIACRNLFVPLAEEHGFQLAEDGFPQKGGTMSAAEAFALFAEIDDAKPHIESLHEKLLGIKIWLWKRGTIEQYLGLESKGESAWARFSVLLNQNGCQATIEDHNGIVEFLNWIAPI